MAVFIGVDLAWSEKNPTGLAIIKTEECGIRSTTNLEFYDTVLSDDELVYVIGEHSKGEDTAIVSIDAPLDVPNEEGRRPAEEVVGELFAKYDAGAHPTNRSNLMKSTGRIRGEDLVKELSKYGFSHNPCLQCEDEERKIVEVYPHPAIVSLFDLDEIIKYKKKGRPYPKVWSEFKRYQECLACLQNFDPPLKLPEEITAYDIEGAKGLELKRREDILDAVLCAYLSYYCWHNPEKCEILGDIEEGYILSPIKNSMEQELELLNEEPPDPMEW